MKWSIMAGVCAGAALLLPPAVRAAGPFDGTWQMQVDTIEVSGRPETYALKGGIFTCATCAPPDTVNADGADHAVAGHSYYDTLAVKVVDARTVVRTFKLSGKAILEDTMVVSPDGQRLTEAYQDLSGAKAAAFSQESARVDGAGTGSHALTGSWRLDKVPVASNLSTTIEYHMTAGGLQMHFNGMSYDAGFDGKPVPRDGDPGKTLISLKRIGADTVEEARTRGGKVVGTTRMTVAADGKTMAVVDADLAGGTTMRYKMRKLP